MNKDPPVKKTNLGSPPSSHSAQMYGPGRIITYKPTSWAVLIKCLQCRNLLIFKSYLLIIIIIIIRIDTILDYLCSFSIHKQLTFEIQI